VWTPRILGVVAIAAIALAYAIPMQSVGCAQSAHYAGIRAIAHGHPYIDRYANETCDLVKENGHYYAAKGPALDLWTAPYYLLLHAAHAVPANPNAPLPYPDAMAGIPLRAVWQIGLWAVVLPALGLLLLVRRTVDRLEPGLGIAAAAILGLATLVLPFSTLLFAHVPAAALAFLSFALLFGRERGPARVAAAGAAAGLAVAIELPLALPAVVRGLYAAANAPRLRQLAVFAAGGAIGLLPLWAFNVWAFGNPLHLAYSGEPGQGAAGGWQQTGFFGQGLPSFRVLAEVLLSQRGLLVVTPVVAAGIAGVAWLLVEHAAPELLRVDRAVHQSYGLVAAVLLAAACTWAVLRPRLVALPSLAFATVRTAEHTKWALLLVILVLAALAVSARVRRSPLPA